jgi:hypothetical protein
MIVEEESEEVIITSNGTGNRGKIVEGGEEPCDEPVGAQGNKQTAEGGEEPCDEPVGAKGDNQTEEPCDETTSANSVPTYGKTGGNNAKAVEEKHEAPVYPGGDKAECDSDDCEPSRSVEERAESEESGSGDDEPVAYDEKDDGVQSEDDDTADEQESKGNSNGRGSGY